MKKKKSKKTATSTQKQTKALQEIIKVCKDLEWVVGLKTDSNSLQYLIIGEEKIVDKLLEKLDD